MQPFIQFGAKESALDLEIKYTVMNNTLLSQTLEEHFPVVATISE